MAWADEFQAASQVADLAKDPDDFRATRQSKVTVNGLLVPVSETDRQRLNNLWLRFAVAFTNYFIGQPPPPYCYNRMTATMLKMLERSATRAKDIPVFNHITLDPRDYTIFTAPHVDVPVISIHTRPVRCWFLGIMRFEGALGLSLGRMRISRPTDKGVYPVTIRTNWRALTNKVKQEEVRDAYQRIIQAPALP